MKEKDVRNTIESIRQKLLRSKTFRESLSTQKPSMKDILEEGVRATHIVKNEFFVSADKIQLLGEKVETIRNYIFTHGRDFRKHPEYKDWLAQDFITAEEAKKAYWLNESGLFDEVLSFTEDQSRLFPDKPTEKLLLTMKSPEKNIEIIGIWFGFHDDFALVIQFGDPEKHGYKEVEYDTSEIPLGHMTIEEYDIITHYCEQHINYINNEATHQK